MAFFRRIRSYFANRQERKEERREERDLTQNPALLVNITRSPELSPSSRSSSSSDMSPSSSPSLSRQSSFGSNNSESSNKSRSFSEKAKQHEVDTSTQFKQSGSLHRVESLKENVADGRKYQTVRDRRLAARKETKLPPPPVGAPTTSRPATQAPVSTTLVQESPGVVKNPVITENALLVNRVMPVGKRKSPTRKPFVDNSKATQEKSQVLDLFNHTKQAGKEIKVEKSTPENKENRKPAP